MIKETKGGLASAPLALGGLRPNGSEDKKSTGQELTGLGVRLCSLTILSLLETKKDKGKKEGLASAPLALGGLRSNGSEEQ